jgi:hypothetical protein
MSSDAVWAAQGGSRPPTYTVEKVLHTSGRRFDTVRAHRFAELGHLPLAGETPRWKIKPIFALALHSRWVRLGRCNI